MHVCVFCMKYETSHFLANPLICLKQHRHNGNCPHSFPLKVTKGKKRGIGDRKTHAGTEMPWSQEATHTRSSLLGKVTSLFCWSPSCCSPSSASWLLCVWRGGTCWCLFRWMNVKKSQFVRVCFAGFLLWVRKSLTMSLVWCCLVLWVTEELQSSCAWVGDGQAPCPDSSLPLLGRACARFLRSLSGLNVTFSRNG